MAIDLCADWFDPAATEAFHAHVDRSEPDGCWPWTGKVDSNGRGYLDLRVDGRRQRVGAHRVAYMLAHGDVPHRHLVASCGLRTCCRPGHWAPKGGYTESGPVTVYRPQPPSRVPHPWLGVIAAVDEHPHGRLADLVVAAVRRVHGLPAGTGWGDVAEAVCRSRETAAQLRDAYLLHLYGLGGYRAAT